MAEGDNTNTPEQEKQVTEEKKEQKKILDEMNKALEKHVNYQTRLARMRGEQISEGQKVSMLLGEQADAAEELLDLAIKRETSIEAILKSHKDYADILDKEVEKGRMLFDAAQEQKKLSEEIRLLKLQIADTSVKEYQQEEERLKLLTEELKKQKEVTAAQQAGVAAGANLVNSMGSLVGMKPNPAFNDFFQNFGKEGSVQGFLRGIQTQMGEVFSLGNVLGFVVTNLVELGVALDSVNASFSAQTGASREYQDQMIGMVGDMTQLGITMQATGESMAALYRDFTLFTELVDENGQRNVALQNEIVATTTQLTKLGISASESANNMNFLMATMGMTGEEAHRTFRTILEQGASLNIPPDQLSAAFQQLQPRLAMFGRQGPDIFMKTAAAAKSLGVSVSELGSNLFALSDGMDEFSESAEKAAALNLALGGSFVDAFDLTMAAAEGPFKQVELLQQGFQRAGKSLGSMPFREQQFLAKNLGMEISTLTAIMDGTIKSQEELNKQQAENPKTLEGMVQKAIPAIEKLVASLQSLIEPLSAIMLPVIETINVFASALGKAFGPVMLSMVVFGIGKFAMGLSAAKAEATTMALSIANVAKELRLMSLQTEQTRLTGLMNDPKALLEQAKAQGLYKAPLMGIETQQQANKAATDALTKSLVEQQSTHAASAKQIQKDLAANNKAMQTNTASVSKLGMAVQAVGMGFSVFFMLKGALDSLNPNLRQMVSVLLAVAGAAGAVMVMMNVIKTGPLKGMAMSIATAALAAGVMGMFSDAPGGTGGVAGIGSIAESGFTTTSGVNDAIIQNDGANTKVTPINKSDQLIAAKPGGPVDEAFQRAGGGGGQIPERLVAALETIAARMSTPAAGNA
jgi:hypothetical protein